MSAFDMLRISLKTMPESLMHTLNFFLRKGCSHKKGGKDRLMTLGVTIRDLMIG